MVAWFDLEEMKNKIKNLPLSFVLAPEKSGLRINYTDLLGLSKNQLY